VLSAKHRKDTLKHPTMISSIETLIRRRTSIATITKSLSTYSDSISLLDGLRKLDTAALCDADKSQGGNLIRLLNSRIQPLVVNSLASTRAIAGELFCTEAHRRGMAGIVIDGPVRDTSSISDLNVRLYASSVTPYSGTTNHPGRLAQNVMCGDVEIKDGEIIVGDTDGVLVGDADNFARLVPIAASIQTAEGALRDRISTGKSLISMTNYVDHLDKRRNGADSSLEFRL